jgi:hypothetical protein
MSRFRRALAAAAPAHAATPGRGHTTTSFTAVPAAQAPGGIGPTLQLGREGARISHF